MITMGDTEATKQEDEHEFLGVEWEVEVRDKDGKITDHKKGRNSLLVGMTSLLMSYFDYVVASGLTLKDIGNVSRSAISYVYLGNWMGFNVVGPAASASYGIVVGSNNTGVTADDYKLNTLIAHGVGAGQLQYLITTLNAVVNASPRSNMRIDRTFTNGSGAPVTVRELGIYVAAGGFYFCICRDVIADTVVANGSSLFVKYTLYITI